MALELTPMKMLQVVVPGERLEAVRELLGLAHVSGYTVIPNVSGMGHHGYHEGRLLFNELSSQVMIVAVVDAGAVDPIVAGLEQLFERGSGVVFVSDCGVRRYGYFVAGDQK
jgi:nitrogen regulatory protein PII